VSEISTVVETRVEALDKAGSTLVYSVCELALHQSDASKNRREPAFGTPDA
jgi:hypothetical protein